MKKLHNRAERPTCDAIRTALRQRILNGELREGERVSSELELVRQLGIGRSLARQALRDLEVEGLLVRRQGSGSFVSHRLPVDQHLDTVQLALPDYETHHARRLVEGFMSRMLGAGMKVMMHNFTMGRHIELDFLSQAPRSGMAGLVVWLLHYSQDFRRTLVKLRDLAFPIVLADRHLPGLDIDCAESDNQRIGYLLTRALIKKGHRNIGLVISAVDHPTSIDDRVKGYRQAMLEAEIEPQESWEIRLFDTPPPPLTRPIEITRSHAHEVTTVMARRVRPTAFFCINDIMALWLSIELIRLGWKIPDDVALAHVEDHEPSLLAAYQRVCIRQDSYAIGDACADALLSRIAQPNQEARLLRIEPLSLMECESEGPR